MTDDPTPDETTVQFASRIARCAAADDGEEFVVHGVALGEDDVTNGEYGLKKWPREVLEPAAETLVDNGVTHLYDDPESHGGDPIGEVTLAGYEPDVGIVYEARLTDEDVANKLALGQYEVSVEGSNPDRVEHDDETGAAILHGIEFDGLAVVERGASPSNHSGAGSAADNPAIAALSGDAIAGLLRDGGAGGSEPESEAETDSNSDDDGEAGDGEVDREATRPAESGADDQSHMADDTPDDPDDSGDIDETAELRTALTERKADLADARDRIDDLEAEVEQLREEREDVALAYAEALTDEDDAFSAEEKADRYEVAELREKVEERDDVALADSGPDVQSGADDPEDDTQVALADLSDDEREELTSLTARAQTFESIDPDHAATLREEAADLVGADAFDDIDTEAL